MRNLAAYVEKHRGNVKETNFTVSSGVKRSIGPTLFEEGNDEIYLQTPMNEQTPAQICRESEHDFHGAFKTASVRSQSSASPNGIREPVTCNIMSDYECCVPEEEAVQAKSAQTYQKV